MQAVMKALISWSMIMNFLILLAFALMALNPELATDKRVTVLVTGLVLSTVSGLFAYVSDRAYAKIQH